jgi:hypothetical protein
MDISADELTEIGLALYGQQWKTPLSQAMNTPRQSIDHYLKAGIRGTQAAALVGVIARTLIDARTEEAQRRAEYDASDAALAAVYQRFSPRVS